MKPKIYIAGPMYSSGDIGENIRNVIEAAYHIKEAGGIPFTPHLYFFWDLIQPQPREFWMEIDKDWLLDCDAVYRLKGVSEGGDDETGWAGEAAMPVFTKRRDVFDFIKAYHKVSSEEGKNARN
jgi:hypothetical protein